MTPIQQATWTFFAPVVAAYLVAACGWFALARPLRLHQAASEAPSARPWLDLALALGAAAAILLIGQVYRAGHLVHSSRLLPRGVAWSLNNVIIYSPIAVVLVAR